MDFPPLLYKYRPCDKYNEDILLAHEMFLPRPSTFNDPFDCRIKLAFDGAPEDWVRFLSARLREGHPDWSDGRLMTEVSALIDGGMPYLAQTPGFAESLIQEDLSKMEVLCLSERRDDILMWAHYADSHRGLCFGFAPQEWVLLKHHAKPVHYQEDYPIVNALRGTLEEARQALAFTKSTAWAYEREWRVVRAATSGQRYRFPAQALAEVIFGARIPPADQRRILVMGHRSPCRPRYLQAVPDTTGYQLNCVELPVTDDIVAEALGEFTT